MFFVLTLWTKSAITFCDNLFLLKFLTYIIMRPSEFEDLYCFFNEQITAQREMLKEKTVLRKNIRHSLRSLEQQKQKIVKRFVTDFPEVWQVNNDGFCKEEFDVLFALLLKHPELCLGLEHRLIAYFEYVYKILSPSGDKVYLKEYLPPLSQLLCSDAVIAYICRQCGVSNDISRFYDWISKCAFKNPEIQGNINQLIRVVSLNSVGVLNF